MGKGSTRRPAMVPQKELERRWNETFKKKDLTTKKESGNVDTQKGAKHEQQRDGSISGT